MRLRRARRTAGCAAAVFWLKSRLICLCCVSLQLEDGKSEGPPLWGVAELAAPLVARLRRHFGGGGMPTDRADRPEWLLATAARLAADLGPAIAPLQPAVEAAGLSHAYAIQVCLGFVNVPAPLQPAVRAAELSHAYAIHVALQVHWGLCQNANWAACWQGLS